METKRLTVFALDDDVADLKLLKVYLSQIEGWEIEVVGFTNWEEGRSELARLAVNVIIIDYLLGRETGLDVVKEIRKIGDERPIIMLTGHGDEEIAAAVSRAGADDYLIKKNLNPDMLRRSIHAVMERYHLRMEHALLEKQLFQAQKMDTIGTLAGGIAHDFNNMLTGVMGHLELALKKPGGKEVSQDLEHAQNICRQMADLVVRLLSFSHRTSSEKQSINVSQTVQEVVTVLERLLPENIELRTCLPDESLTLYANAVMLHQIVFNICVNATEAMPDGGELLIEANKVMLDQEFTIRHPEAYPGNHIQILVRDSGVGMEKKIINRIFEPFFTTKELGFKRGTGLGLAVVWQNAMNHGGFIVVYSEPGNGTTFRIYFPISEAPVIKDRSPKASPSEIPRGDETILLVEDEAVIRDLAARLLQQLGYKVYLAPDGAKALETYDEIANEVSAVLMDLSMPIVNGKECLKQLIKINPDIRVMLSSGHDISSQAEELMSIGAKGVIQKPYSMTDLAYRIRALIDA